MIEEGKKAPPFALPNADGKEISLKDFPGVPVVLYFYPKDNTPGCTQEACDFRDNFSRIGAAGAVVLGVSADSASSHRKFMDKFNLPFELLSDADKSTISAYGAWKEKSMYGKTFLGIERRTVIIGPDGRIFRIFPKVKVKGHVDEVLAALRELKG